MKDIASILGIGLDKRLVKIRIFHIGAGQFSAEYRSLEAVVSCPFDYSSGLAAMMRDEWGINPSLKGAAMLS